jgi:hypothetical protein
MSTIANVAAVSVEEPAVSAIEIHTLSNSRNRGGRPKGTTKKAKQDEVESLDKAITAASLAYAHALTNKSTLRLPRGTVDTCIAIAKKDHSIPDDVKISKETVLSRVKRRNEEGLRVQSPMPWVIEKILVGCCIAAKHIGFPLRQATFLQLANSLIQQTNFERDIIAWKVKCNAFKDAAEQGAQLGKKYYENFMKRHAKYLTSVKGHKVDSTRAEWCTYENFRLMYDDVYAYMVEAGVAENLIEPAYFDKDGNQVATSDEAVGLLCDAVLKHPEYLIVVDETGFNTNQLTDNSNNQNRYIGVRGENLPQLSVSTSDFHCTLLPFTAGNGQPVMFAVIFAWDGPVPTSWVHSLDYFKLDNLMKTKSEIEQSELVSVLTCDDDVKIMEYVKTLFAGQDSVYTGGPECQFNGVNVPCYVGHSPKGGITSEMLADMLRTMDGLNLFPRTPLGPKPFLLLDGHGSRFELPFLEYIWHQEHQWFVAHGVPNGTAVWQVGDTSEQNGTAKVEKSEATDELILLKEKYGQPRTIKQHDIMPIMNRIVQKAFCWPDRNVCVHRRLGWGPRELNRNILTFPEVLRTRMIAGGDDNESVNNTMEASSELDDHDIGMFTNTENTTNNSTKSTHLVIDKVVQQINAVDGKAGEFLGAVLRKAENEHERRKKMFAVQQSIASGFEGALKKLTAGTHFKNGEYGPGNCRLGAELLTFQRQKQADKDAAASQTQQRKQNQADRQRDKVIAARIKEKNDEKLTIDDLKSLCLWKKKMDDPSLATTRAGLEEQYAIRKGRSEPPFPEADEGMNAISDLDARNGHLG